VSNTPIADYALLSDCRSAALVSRGGSVDWLCFPRFDGPAVFGRLLDERAGHWSIRTVGEAQMRRRYIGATMAIETTFVAATGTATLVDALAVGRNERGHELGLDSPGVLLRLATCVRGVVEIELEYAPRPEYGLVHPLLTAVEGGVMARGGADRLLLSLPVPATIQDGTARARFALHEGEQAYFALQHRAAWEPIQQIWTQAAIGDRLADTLDGWRSWSAMHQAYEGPWRDLVHHSGRGPPGAHLPAHGGNRRGADHFTPRECRWWAQLGLSLRVGARRVLHDGRAVDCRMSRRGASLLQLDG